MLANGNANADAAFPTLVAKLLPAGVKGLDVYKRQMEVYTTENGVQLYTGNWLGGFEGAHGATFPARSAVCFEAQCFPDTPNKSHFPSAVLLPGDEYQQVTIYKFGVQE